MWRPEETRVAKTMQRGGPLADRTLDGFLAAFKAALWELAPEVPQHQKDLYPFTRIIRVHVANPGSWLVPPFTDPVGLVYLHRFGTLPSLLDGLRSGQALGLDADLTIDVCNAADREKDQDEDRDREALAREAFLQIMGEYACRHPAK